MMAFVTKTHNSGSHLRKMVCLKSAKWKQEQETSIIQTQNQLELYILILFDFVK